MAETETVTNYDRKRKGKLKEWQIMTEKKKTMENRFMVESKKSLRTEIERVSNYDRKKYQVKSIYDRI